MQKTSFFGLIFLALIIILLWAAPALALDDPWDGTKASDTVITTNGDSGQDPHSSDGDDNGGLIGVIIKWLSERFTISNGSNKAKLEIKEQADRSNNRQTMTIFRKHSFRR